MGTSNYFTHVSNLYNTTSSNYFTHVSNLYNTTSSNYFTHVSNLYNTTSSNYFTHVSNLYNTTSSNYFTHVSNLYNITSSNKKLLRTPMVRTTTYGAIIWNNIAIEIREVPSNNTFKKMQKNILFHHTYYNSVVSVSQLIIY